MKIINVKLNEWFPSDDVFSTEIARLCVLREELMFELHCAMDSKNVPTNDDFSTPWRMNYFIRKMFCTLVEIRSVIETLSKEKDFKYFIRNKSSDFKKLFQELKDNLNSAADLFKDIRNNIGAHIPHSSMNKSLQRMSTERSGFLQISQYTPRNTHFKFAGELVMAVMFRDVPSEEQEKRAIEIIDEFVRTTKHLFYIIDLLFFSYAKDRKLL